MRLKKIELYGFKSFADKIELEFGPGITAIVGPNGSGKSNISDAIRWVLGEQSVRLLRGSKMEDVIFIGSDRRKALGLAEAVLTFDNSDGALPLEFAEISVMRRVFRSGEGEYFINKVPCRLRDLNELFMDTGIGKEGYSVIEQGKIDELLNAKSGELRAFFEEAAGVTRYKLRKQETARKLEDTRRNQLRVNDIIAELERQMGPLEAQAGVAQAFSEYSAEKKDLEVQLWACELQELSGECQASKIRHSEAEALVLNSAAHLSEIENLVTEARRNLAENEDSLERARQEAGEVSAAANQVEGRIRLAEERRRSLGEQINRVSEFLEGKAHTISSLEAEHESHHKRLAELNVKIEGCALDIEGKEKARLKAERAVHEASETVERVKGDIIETLNKIAEIRNSLTGMDFERENALRRISRLDEDITRSLVEKATMGARRDTAGRELERLDANLQRLRESMETCSREGQAARQELERLSTRRLALDEEYGSRSLRLQALLDLQKEGYGYREGVKAVLSHKSREAADEVACGIHYAVAGVLRVPKEYEVAIEAAIEEFLQNIVTDSIEDARFAIEFLKKTKGGRAAFLSLDLLGPASLAPAETSILTVEGVHGVASDLVEFDPKDAKVVNYLLGRVVVVEDMSTAVRILKAAHGKVKAVTLAGDVVGPGGLLIGGSLQGEAPGLLRQSREIRELKDEVQALREQLEEARSNEEKARAIMNLIGGNLDKLQAEAYKTELDVSNLQEEIGRLDLELARIVGNLGVLNMEREQIQALLPSYEEKRSFLSADLEVQSSQYQFLEASMKDAGLRIKEESAKEKALLAAITERKVEIAGLREERTYLLENITRVEKSLLDLVNARALGEQQKLDLLAELDRIGISINEDERLVSTLNEAKAEKASLVSGLVRRRRELTASIGENEALFKSVRMSMDENKAKAHEAEIQENSLTFKMDGVKRRLFETYGLSLEDLTPDLSGLDREAMAKRVEELKDLIKDLGMVNVGAIREFDALKERYDFLRKERDDLAEARESLTCVMTEIEKTIKKRFLETFDSVRVEFAEIFSNLFGGGQADLILADRDNPLESEMGIVAQPPGKRLHNLSLLSGGERSLVIIALVFAILKVKPSPFCVLDEIDAALDEANVDRFAELLRGFAERSQFIIVTHRKATMEAANVLYGVTMEESGTSKLISVCFDELQNREGASC